MFFFYKNNDEINNTGSNGVTAKKSIRIESEISPQKIEMKKKSCTQG
jgi:hypothetical protein